MTLVILIAPGWGYTNGGINVFNRELCRGLGCFVTDQLRVLCVAPDIPPDEIDKVSKNENIVLLNVNRDEFERSKEIVNIVNDYCNRECIASPSVVWLGHDTYSDRQALECKKLWSGSICALIHHMSYGTYYPLINLDSDKSEEKERVQRERLSAADIVFANGPLLKESAQDLCGRNDNIFEILPGVFNVKTIKERTPNFFNVVSFGRIEPPNTLKRSNSIIKQIFLAVASWAKFTSELKSTDVSAMKIYGKSDDTSDSEFIKLLKKYSNGIYPFSVIPYETNHEKLLESLSNFSLCLVLSSREGFGLTALEAISAGIPVIVSDSSGFFRALQERALDGFVYPVSIQGALDEPYYSDSDLINVSKAIRKVFDEKDNAKKKALMLRAILLGAGCTWENCAKTVLMKLGITLSSGEGETKTLIDEDYHEDKCKSAEKTSNSNGKLIVVTGFIAAKESMVISQLLSLYNNYEVVIEATDETPGEQYRFLKSAEYTDKICDKHSLEHLKLDDNNFGEFRKALYSKLNQGINVILEQDFEADSKIKERFPEALIVYVFPPDVNTIKNQLDKENADDDCIRERLSKYSREAYSVFNGNILLVNDVPNNAAKRLNEMIENPNTPKDGYNKNVELVVTLKKGLDEYLEHQQSVYNFIESGVKMPLSDVKELPDKNTIVSRATMSVLSDMITLYLKILVLTHKVI